MMTPELRLLYIESFPENLREAELIRLGFATPTINLQQKELLIHNISDNIKKQLLLQYTGPVIQSPSNTPSVTLVYNANHGTNFTFDELVDFYKRKGEAMGYNEDYSTNPANWDKLDSQANYLYTSNVVIPTAITATATAPYLATNYLAPGTIGGNLIGTAAGGIAVGEGLKEALKAVGLEPIGDTISRFAEDKLGVSPYVSPFLLPEYWVNPMGGRYTKPLFQKGANVLEDALDKFTGRFTDGGFVIGKYAYKPDMSTLYSGLPFGIKRTLHIQGNDAVEMLHETAEMLHETVPQNNSLYKILHKYVPEVRVRYKLPETISDDLVARGLYSHVTNNLNNNIVTNSSGLPLILFRGDTKPYDRLIERPSPHLLAKMSGTMDNSFGTLFLGNFGLPHLDPGVGRYLIGWKYNSALGMYEKNHAWGSFTSDMPDQPIGGYDLFKGTFVSPRREYFTHFIKAPSQYSKTGVNDLNAFVVRTPNVRDASHEISVLSDDFLAIQPTWRGPKIENGLPTREQMADHIQSVLDDALNKNLGLLYSSRINPKLGITEDNILREEHGSYNYYVVPNFNIHNVKHILPYDMRIPVDWNDSNIYRKHGGKL